ncbi:hypothetical protein RCH09_001082 [Actimicrobium sp. GrIS 1.19]|uniref:hypothetical protein n=1 Tax=Actimicrobium sp. GrIS 1.19 TaxID=3071708 RepID=UPI002E0C0913|nr:hypothetical protein [Actimicrobium sp. GrIS 1.19]
MTSKLKNRMLSRFAVAAIATLAIVGLTACGGGGGAAGTTGAAGSGKTPVTPITPVTPVVPVTPVTPTVAPVPKLTITLFSGTTSTSSVSASGVTSAKATVVDDNNNPVRGKLVTFSGDPALIKFNPASGSVLTDAVTGIATVQILPAGLSSGGAGTLSASATVVPAAGGTGILTAGTLDFQLSPGSLTLTSLDVQSSTPLAAYGTRSVSVTANIDGVAATNTPIQVTFASNCGVVAPATVTTDGTGKASSTYTANSTTIPGCAGANVTITAGAVSATTLSGAIAVQPTLATNLQFVSAAPQLIYLVDSVGATQSQVTFKVVDSSNNTQAGQPVNLSLANSAPGVSFDTVGNTGTVTQTSNYAGLVSVPVFSGSIPTSLQVNAVLVSNPSVKAKSNTLLVASGVPVQSAASIAAEKLSIEGLFTDGVTDKITFSLADRQGNPVPVGTSVNFVSSSGVMVPATCVVPAALDGTSTSACTTTIRSQGTRPANGRVAILAYTPGEEDFVDANGNNVYDLGESFTDLGNAYRDDNFDDVFNAGEFVVPRTKSPGSTGLTTCPVVGNFKGSPDTCDGVWGVVDVRGHIMVVFASGQATFSALGTARPNGVRFTVADVNGNSMPTGTKIEVTGRAAIVGGTCTAIVTPTPTIIPNQVGPYTAKVTVDPACAAGDFVDITVTSPAGLATSTTLTLT